MITLFHAPQSRSSRIIWLLEELGAPYEIRLVDIPRMDGSGAPDPNNPHPDKKAPALVDGDVLVTESIAIVLYLADKFPAAKLAPPIGDPKRGAYLTWVAYYAGVIEPVVMHEFVGLGDHPALQRTFRGLPEMQARILAALKTSPYLLGDAFSAADLLIATLGQWARQMLPADTIVDDYIARCTARPALARANARDNG